MERLRRSLAQAAAARRSQRTAKAPAKKRPRRAA